MTRADRGWCPLNTWSKLPDASTADGRENRLVELVGAVSYSNIQFEVAPGFVGILCSLALKDKPFIDATVAAHRAAPEISQNSLNLDNVPCTPAVWQTIHGDLLVLEKVLCFQSMEE